MNSLFNNKKSKNKSSTFLNDPESTNNPLIGVVNPFDDPYKNVYDKDGFDKYGYDKNGFDQNGYDHFGWDQWGYDKNGYDKYGNYRS